MTFAELSKLLSGTESPVVLLEGTRELPAHRAATLTALAAHLAHAFEHARFRTGNAKGSDAAFAAGVASVDPSRLEFVLPYATHRSRERPTESPTAAMDDVSSERMQEVVDATLAVSPQYERVAVNYRERKTHPRQRATARLILRDTLKVTGTDTMPPPVAGIFYVHASDPGRGGTGHTMRVCRAHGVPVINQFQWLEWTF
jgi:hypothetical protein